MRIIHGGGYSKQDRVSFIPLVCRNVYTAVQVLTNAMRTLEIPYETEGAKAVERAFDEVHADSVQVISSDHQKAIATLWQDGGIKKCYQRRREYQISDSAKQ